MKEFDKNNKIVYIDLDDTIANFFEAAGNYHYPSYVDERYMYDKDFFFNLKPIPGALRNVRGIIQLGFDVWILTQPLFNSFKSYEEKAKWVNLWLPELSSRLIMTQNKGLHLGDYLIDDRIDKWKEPFEKNGGKFVHFNYDRIQSTPGDLKRQWELIYQFFFQERAKL